MTDPAFLFYPESFMVGVVFMTDEQVGKYIRLLCLQHSKGHLTYTQLHKICNDNDQEILDKFKKDDKGNYFNKRLDDEVIRRQKYTENRLNNFKKKPHMNPHMEDDKGTHMNPHTITTTTTITKDINKDKEKSLFDNFWKAYPRKMSKGQAEKTFKKLNPDEQLLKTIISAIEKAKKTADWQKDNGQFIPYPSTWLNSKGWLDEIPEETNEKGFPERDYEEKDIEDLYFDPLKEQLKEG